MTHVRRLLPVLALAFLAGCTKYPQVGFENLEYVAALRTACSAKDPRWLSDAAAAIAAQHDSGEMADEEFDAYRSIIETAESGDWSAAERECLRFQKDQLAE